MRSRKPPSPSRPPVNSNPSTLNLKPSTLGPHPKPSTLGVATGPFVDTEYAEQLVADAEKAAREEHAAAQAMPLIKEICGEFALHARTTITFGGTPCTLHPTPYTLHPAPNTLKSTPHNLNPEPCTLHPTP